MVQPTANQPQQSISELAEKYIATMDLSLPVTAERIRHYTETLAKAAYYQGQADLFREQRQKELEIIEARAKMEKPLHDLLGNMLNPNQL